MSDTVNVNGLLLRNTLYTINTNALCFRNVRVNFSNFSVTFTLELVA